jgi:exonuclease 3'-5' domain-containing protein 1
MNKIETEIVSTEKQMVDLVDQLALLNNPRNHGSPSLFIDLEGVGLCRDGSISILTLLIHRGGSRGTTGRVYLIDVYSMGPRAFNTAVAERKTL